jgi:hypothetical protein
MPNTIDVASLTTCLVPHHGTHIHLNFDDIDGRSATLVLPTPCVHQLLMTLPHLLSTALRVQHADASARAVFPLDEWRLEAAAGTSDLILTMKTPDGFEVAFSLSTATLARLSAAGEEKASSASEWAKCLAS